MIFIVCESLYGECVVREFFQMRNVTDVVLLVLMAIDGGVVITSNFVC